MNGRSLILVALLTAFALAGCGDHTTEAPSTVRQSLGEPTDGYPSYQERLVHYFTNRARTEPAAFNPDDPYAPTHPLKFDLDLAKAARFHAQHIVDASCWCEDHSSCCELTGTGDDVTCGGPMIGCGATDAGTRVGLFSPSYNGENMARGQQTAREAVEGWIFSPGHWANMNNPTSTRLGAGHHPGAWVQDFGTGGVPPVIGDGIHFGDGRLTRFGITYWQTGTSGPMTALVIVAGECHDLDLQHGEPELGAFETAVSLDPGCHRYYFHFTDGDGDDHSYPSTGSFGVSVGGEACPFYIDTRPADTCSPSGQTCVTGDTRHCYTGPFGTEGVGICEAGVERCVGGQWDGDCRLEILPAEVDACHNGLDDDCDGEVDEECAEAEDDPAADVGKISEPDMGTTDAATGATAKPEPEPRGCSTAGGSAAGNTLCILVVMVLARRRKN